MERLCQPYEECPQGDKDTHTEYLYPFTELERGEGSECNKFYGASGTQNWTPQSWTQDSSFLSSHLTSTSISYTFTKLNVKSTEKS